LAGSRTSSNRGREERINAERAWRSPSPGGEFSLVAKRAFEAMMKMRKIDVAAIEAAVRG
jgi:hypothetical protein